MRGHNHEFLKNGSYLFFPTGLEHADPLERHHEIRLFAHASLGPEISANEAAAT
jgi:hypothetical protein